ncbi:MAG TPA: SDR family oxidoreductase [Acidimicrobiales bacterium]|nr:SDR family oxidoreductase [Acidimicrobiales bacterium]
MTSLSGRVVVVTGAGRGMGAGIAEAVVDAGASVALVDVIAGSAEQTAERLGAARAVALTGDVTVDDDITRTLAVALERFGRLDGWVNNAGVIEMAPAIETTRSNFEAHFAVNTTAVLRCCQAAASHWRSAGHGGAIVNIASYAGKVGYPDMISYNVSKAGVINLTRNLAHEWARFGVNVNCLCPSGVDTPMLDAVASYLAAGGDPAPIRASMNAGDLGRNITPLEIGRVVAFLLSDDARAIRGQAISVDGGDSPY